MPARLRSLVVLSLFLAGAGCVRVKATERGTLSTPAMVAGPGAPGEAIDAAYRSKLVESRSGGGLPGNAPGGGCGCAQ